FVVSPHRQWRLTPYVQPCSRRTSRRQPRALGESQPAALSLEDVPCCVDHDKIGVSEAWGSFLVGMQVVPFLVRRYRQGRHLGENSHSQVDAVHRRMLFRYYADTSDRITLISEGMLPQEMCHMYPR